MRHSSEPGMLLDVASYARGARAGGTASPLWRWNTSSGLSGVIRK
jgi:hypothetical protein